MLKTGLKMVHLPRQALEEQNGGNLGGKETQPGFSYRLPQEVILLSGAVEDLLELRVPLHVSVHAHCVVG